LAGTAALNADGPITAPSYKVGTTSYDNVDDARSALDSNTGSSKYCRVNSTLADSSASGADSVGDALIKIDSELGNKVTYDTTRKTHITLGGAGTSALVTTSNVAESALTASSTDAVNMNLMQQSVNTGVKSAKGYADALRSNMNSGLSLSNNHINSVGAMIIDMAMMAGSAAAVADKDNRFAAGASVYRTRLLLRSGPEALWHQHGHCGRRFDDRRRKHRRRWLRVRVQSCLRAALKHS
jgi:hypothetical protein